MTGPLGGRNCGDMSRACGCLVGQSCSRCEAAQHTPPAPAPSTTTTPRTDAAPKREGKVDRRG